MRPASAVRKVNASPVVGTLVRALKLWFRQRDATHKVQERLGALAALCAAAAGGVNPCSRSGLTVSDSLLHLPVSQGIAETDIHANHPSLRSARRPF